MSKPSKQPRVTRPYSTKSKQLIEELKKEREELLKVKEELKAKDKTISNLQKEFDKLKLSDKPKYMGVPNLTLNQEIIEQTAIIVRSGLFNVSEISSFLGINRITFQKWIEEAKSGKLQEDDLRYQLYQVMEYSKHIFFLQNQQAINKSALSGKTLDAKWNLESRFNYLRTNTTNIKNNISLGNNDIVVEEISEEDKKVLKVSKEITYLIQQSIDSD